MRVVSALRDDLKAVVQKPRVGDRDRRKRPQASSLDHAVDLLHVDDLGVEKRSDWVLEQLYAVVNERYEMERSMVVTTNLEQPALEEQIGERTVSRLIEICGPPLTVDGEDLRYPRAPAY